MAETEFEKIIEKLLDAATPIGIWGIGKDCEKFYQIMEHMFLLCNMKKPFEKCINFVIDNNPLKQGRIYFGREIRSKEHLQDIGSEALIIIATSKYYSEIADELEQADCAENMQYISSGELAAAFAKFKISDENFKFFERFCMKNNEIAVRKIKSLPRGKRVALFFADGYGEMSPSLMNTAYYLSEQGYRVDIFFIKYEAYESQGLGLRRIDKADVYIYEIQESVFLNIHGFIPMLESCMENSEQYSFFIAFDPRGLYPAAVMGKILDIPYVYHSLEFCEEENILKKIEECYAKTALTVLTQDEQRKTALSGLLHCDRDHIRIVHNSPIGKAIRTKGNYFRDKFCISADQHIVLFVGGIHRTLGLEGILHSMANWSSDFVLVVHGWVADPELYAMAERIAQQYKEKIFLSTDILSYEEKYKLFQSADIGLVFYELEDLNVKNMKYVAGSSGKLYDFIRCGVPVIAKELPGMKELIAEDGIGKVVANYSEISKALLEIEQDYDSYRKRCWEKYEDYEFTNDYRKLLNFIEASL